MKIISTNIGKSTTIIWNGKEEQTGIYKYATTAALHLRNEGVQNDTISNKKVHGGFDKACYLFSSNHYQYWKELYPDLPWQWGMFGENLTVENLDEATLRIGDIYKIGTALVEVSQPREPCYKLGIRFGTQKILKQFIAHNHPGAYVRVLKEGMVAKGDSCTLITQSKNTLTIQEFYKLLFAKEKNLEMVTLAINNKALPEHKKMQLKKYV
ncbi:MOSC domain-containing protein [Cellulophaga sp. F20128]|uniref:MOSC domain-containing protein n=1 Tax=Cellulophaga sp. F20128 TaxID=2926413 RepID=UPI001FF4C37B|nr:MOSC domain-containing protein [Cellulophaga sp. F20128]MCK0158374.1 MOSC domain-containing protein [Cellulophaga sp. F20128]